MIRGSHVAPDGRRPVVAACLTVVAAAVGGLAAAALVPVPPPIAVGISVMVGVLTEIGLARRSGQAPGQPDQTGYTVDGNHSHGRRWSDAPPAQHPAPPPDPPRPNPVVQLLPAEAGVEQPQSSSAPWWAAADQMTSTPPQLTDEYTDPPGLATYLHTALIAQCPSCGAFDLDIDSSHPAAWRVRCRRCRADWRWPPGSPWPQVRMLRGGQVAPRSTGFERKG